MRDEEKKDPTEETPEPVDPGETEEERKEGERLATGMALGISFGVALSLVLDNWAMVGAGIALGAAYGLIPWDKDDDADEGRERPQDD